MCVCAPPGHSQQTVKVHINAQLRTQDAQAQTVVVREGGETATTVKVHGADADYSVYSGEEWEESYIATNWHTHRHTTGAAEATPFKNGNALLREENRSEISRHPIGWKSPFPPLELPVFFL